LAYCEEGLTDGFIPSVALDFLGVKGARHLVPRLEAAQLWQAVDGGWRVHDYAEHHRSAQQVREIRNRRRDAGRQGGVASAASRAKQGASTRPKQSASRRTKQDASAVPKQAAEANLKQTVEANLKQTSNPDRSEADRSEADRKSDARARGARHAFRGSVLALTHAQHELLVRMCNGVDVDLLGKVYPRWNRLLEQTGESFDPLTWCTARLKRDLRIGRDGHGVRPVSAVDEAAAGEFEQAQRARQTRDEAKRTQLADLADSVLAVLSDEERAAVEVEAFESLQLFRTRMTSVAYQDAVTQARRTVVLSRCSEADLKARLRDYLGQTKPLGAQA